MAAPQPEAVSVSRRAKHKDTEGFVRVTNEFITWFPADTGAKSMKKVAIGAVKGIQKTKEGHKKALMKVSHTDGDLILEFAHKKSGRPDFRERTAVEEAIISLMAQYKQQQEEERGAVAASGAGVDVAGIGRAEAGGSADRPDGANRKQNADAAMAVALESNITLEEIKRREELLRTNSEISELHKRLVAGNLISDADFWHFTYHRLDSPRLQAATTTTPSGSQTLDVKRGIPSVWDTEVQSEDNSGTLKVRLTPAVRHRVFVENPEVQLAYRANVPKKMKDQQFWEMFARSSYFHKSRSSGTAMEADKLFAQYEDKAAEAIQTELKDRSSALDLSISLDRADDHRIVHTRDVHEEGGSNKKMDMYLPKLRHVNRHGTLVLDSNAAKRAPVWAEDKDILEHPIPDLEIEAATKYIPLTLSNRSAFYEGIGGRSTMEEKLTNTMDYEEAMKRHLTEMMKDFEGWQPDLARFRNTIPAAEEIHMELFRGTS